MRFIQGQPEFKSSLFKRKSVVWFWSLFPQIHFFKFCPCNPAVSFLNSLFFKVTRDKNNEKESRQSFIFHFVSREKIPLLRSSKWNTWRRTVSGHKKGPYGCHRSRVRGPLCRQIGSDGTFDGVMETKDKTRCTRLQTAGSFVVRRLMVSAVALAYLSLLFSLRFWQSRVRQTKREQRPRGR